MGLQYNQKKQKLVTLHPEANRAYKTIKYHDAVAGKVNQPEAIEGGGFKIRFEIEVSLPSNARKDGISKTGVRAIEPVFFHFPASYPYKAPKIYLRPDFNRCLPHINPMDIHHKELVNPCVYYGNLDELLHVSGNGLCEIINHVSEWLGRAAIDDLIDPEQGWEPTRRDETSGWIVYDLSGMRSLVEEIEGAMVFQCKFFLDIFQKRRSYFVWGIYHDKPKTISSALLEHSINSIDDEGGTIFSSLVFFAWPNKFEKGILKIADQYLPETVCNLEQLFERAKIYGCYDSLKNVLIEFCWALKKSQVNIDKFPLFIILCARRPSNLINDYSPLELIPYMISCYYEEILTPMGEGKIRIVTHLDYTDEMHEVLLKELQSF